MATIQTKDVYVDTLYEKDQLRPDKGLIVHVGADGSSWIGNGETFKADKPTIPEQAVTTVELDLTAAQIQNLAFTPVSVEDFGVPTRVEILGFSVVSPTTTQFNATVNFQLRIASTVVSQLAMATTPTANVYFATTQPNGSYFGANGDELELTAAGPYTNGEDCKVVVSYIATAI